MSMSRGIDRSAYVAAFREEMREHLQALTEALLALESQRGGAAAVGELFRRVHTIKGAARLMGFGHVADVAHSMEDVLDDLRAGRLRVGPWLLDAMLTAVDTLRKLVRTPPGEVPDTDDAEAVRRRLVDLRRPSAGPPGTVPEEEQAVISFDGPGIWGLGRETVRVDVGRIDTILNLAGELMVVDAARRQRADEMARMLAALSSATADARAGDLVLGADQIRRVLQRVSDELARVRRLASQGTEVLREIHYQVSALRMLPIRTLFSIVPRAARDMARDAHKEIEVLVEGEDTEIDRDLLERLRAPVLHLVRNAVAHGVESPAERIAAGKPRAGRIRVGAYSRGARATIEIEDDGRGVDFASVRSAAVRLGMLSSAEAEAMDESGCIGLLFSPGFTTSPTVSQSAGRGVGLDVVKADMDELKGYVRLETRPGRGTKVTLDVPITLAYTHVLLIEVGRCTYGLPCASTQGIVQIPVDAVRTLQSRDAVEVGGQTVPVVWMHRVLGAELSGRRKTARLPAVLLGPSEQPIAFLVDRVVSDDNVIVKPLGPLLRRVPFLSGCTILGDGRVALLLSASTLCEAARSMDFAVGEVLSPRVPAPSRRVLVVDDAAITRELERAILDAAGYEVETATDGQDALAKLRSREYALVVADIEMPVLDGLELTAAIREDARLRGLPVVVVSSRESDEDRQRAMEIGAQAYLPKGAFDRVALLDTIETLIG